MPPLQSTNAADPVSCPPSPPSTPPSPPSPTADTKLPSPHSTFPSPPSPSSLSRSSPSPSSSPSPHPTPPPALIIFDWDDTLLSSSFLSSHNVRLDSDLSSLPSFPTLHPQLALLDRCVSSLLSTALSLTPHVHIITNAETGWVQLSAAKFLPTTFPLLSRVRVLSARSTYEAVFPDCPHKWKYCAFQREVQVGGKAGGGGGEGWERSVISLGDSHVEREAVRAATRGLAGVRCKSVKFAERSTVEQLRRQVELVSSCFHYIHQHKGDLDLQLTVTVNHTTPDKGDKGGEHAPTRAATGADGSLKKEQRESNRDVSEYDGSGDSEMGSERESEHDQAACAAEARRAAAQMAA